MPFDKKNNFETMIQAKDLRIGNYFYDERTMRNITVSPFDFQFAVWDYSLNEFVFKFLTPIPLIPEILEECGFVLYHEWDNELGGYLSPKFELGRIILKEKYWYNGSWHTKLTHLHELQNLWKALTGEELIVNL